MERRSGQISAAQASRWFPGKKPHVIPKMRGHKYLLRNVFRDVHYMLKSFWGTEAELLACVAFFAFSGLLFSEEAMTQVALCRRKIHVVTHIALEPGML